MRLFDLVESGIVTPKQAELPLFSSSTLVEESWHGMSDGEQTRIESCGGSGTYQGRSGQGAACRMTHIPISNQGIE